MTDFVRYNHHARLMEASPATRVADERLDSWKAIAAYLRRDVRTVRRWEQHEGLPVHRHVHHRGATVFAYVSELDAWSATRAAALDHSPSPARWRNILSRSAGGLALAVTLSALWLIDRTPRSTASELSPPVRGRLWAAATGEGQEPAWIRTGGLITALAITGDGARMLAADVLARTVHVIDLATNRVVATVPLPAEFSAFAASPDGTWIAVGTARGDVLRIAARSLAVDALVGGFGRVTDLAFMPEGRRLYITSLYEGLHVLELSSATLRHVPTVRCPVSVAANPARNELYVGYQCNALGGPVGHEAIDVRNLATDEALHAIAGPPQIVDQLTVSPDGSQLWADGHDACTSPEYDHVGCPIVPGGIINIYRTDDRRLLRSLGTPQEEPSGFSFFPDGSRVLVNGIRPQVIDVTSFRILEEVALPLIGRAAFEPSGRRAYVPAEGGRIAVFDLAGDRCLPRPASLAAWWPGDGSAADIATINAGTLQNGATTVPAWIGQGFSLDGVDDHIQVPTLSNVIMNEGFSLGMWLKPARRKVADEVVLDNAPTEAGGWRLLNAAGRVAFCHQSDAAPCGPGGRWSVQANTPLATGDWTHVSIVSTPDRLDLYVNGRLDASTRLSARPYAQRQDLRIGGPFVSGAHFAGLLDEIQIFGREISAEEIRRIAAAGRDGVCVR